MNLNRLSLKWRRLIKKKLKRYAYLQDVLENKKLQVDFKNSWSFFKIFEISLS